MDFDDDGKLDLIAGDTKGQVWLFRNTGTRTKPVLAAGVRIEAAGKPIAGAQRLYRREGRKLVVTKVIPGNHKLASKYSKIHMGDWDGDGLKDLLIGHDREIIWYRNVGRRGAPEFTDPVKLPLSKGKFPLRPSPYLVDWDGDGKQDLLCGSESKGVIFYRNVGTAGAPELAAGKALELSGPGFEHGYRRRIGVADWNDDGKLDLLVGDRYSVKQGGETRRGGNIWLFLR